MKLLIKEIYVLDEEYQEILVDENNFTPVKYKPLAKQSINIHGVMYDNIYILEPLKYYKIKLEQWIPFMKKFIPIYRLLEAGLIFSDINLSDLSIFVYNSSRNHVYIKDDVSIGEIE